MVRLQVTEACLPGQEAQQSLWGMVRSQQACWQDTFSQVTSPSWGNRRRQVRRASHLPRAAPSRNSYTSSWTHGKVSGRSCRAWSSPEQGEARPSGAALRKLYRQKIPSNLKVSPQVIKAVKRQAEDGRTLAKRLQVWQREERLEAAPGWAAPGSPGPAHLAYALGTGLIVQGEHLAVPHLPPLVVAVCSGQRRQEL